MNIAFNPNINFTKISRKVLTRDPILVTQIRHPIIVNDEFSKRTTGESNKDINNYSSMTDMQAMLRAREFERLLERQRLAQNRSGDILERLEEMDKKGYQGIIEEVHPKVFNALLKLDKKTITALNDFQLFRICYLQNGNRSTVEGLMELEKEFTCEELMRLSLSQDSTIINTWINKLTSSDIAFERLTKYIHEISKR